MDDLHPRSKDKRSYWYLVPFQRWLIDSCYQGAYRSVFRYAAAVLGKSSWFSANAPVNKLGAGRVGGTCSVIVIIVGLSVLVKVDETVKRV